MTISFLVGLAALAALFVLGRFYVSAEPKQLVSLARYAVMTLAVTLGLLLVVRGSVGPGFALIGGAYAFWRWAGRGSGPASTSGAGHHNPGPMDREQALQILGLSGSPSVEEINQAHKALIQKLHPDKGGTDFLAAQLNAAREILVKSAS